jgi:hypothetical protein
LHGAQDEVAEVAPMLKPGGQCSTTGEITPRCRMLVEDANNRLDRAERLRTTAVIGIGAGAAVLIAGTILRVLAEDPHKYDFERPRDDAGIGLFAAFAPGGSTLVLRGHF